MLASMFTFVQVKLDTQHFELFFSSADLKKGLSYFKRGDFSFAYPNQVQRKQLIVAGCNLQLRLEGMVITEAFCSCNKGDFCPHLATAIFALNQAVFHKDFSELLQQSIRSGFKEISFEKVYQFAREELLSITKLQKPKGRKQELASFFELNPFGFERALICLCLLHELKFSSDVELIERTKSNLVPKLQKLLLKGLSTKQKELWRQAAICSLRSNTALSSGVFQFLVPPLLLMKLPVLRFAELEHVLQKRKFQQFHREGPDPLQLLRYQVGYVNKRPRKRDWDKLSDWDLVALADLFYLEGKSEKALALLKLTLEGPARERELPLRQILFYGLQKSKAARDNEGELYFLKFVLRSALQADTAVLERMRELCGAKDYREIMLTLAKVTPDDWLDKKTDLYLESANHEALIFFAKHSPLRATKLIQVLSAALPLVPNDVVANLSIKVTEALRSAPNREMQLVLIESLTCYRAKLSKKDADALLNKIRELLGQRSHLADML